MGRASNQSRMAGQAGFQVLLGGRRGRSDDDAIWAVVPTASAYGEFERLCAAENESEALAVLGARTRLVADRALLTQLSERICDRYAERQNAEQRELALLALVSAGVRARTSDVLVRAREGRGKVHIWPHGTALGHSQSTWPGAALERTLCRKTTSDVVGPGTRVIYKFPRANHGAWLSAPESQRCPKCAEHADEYEDTGYTPNDVPPLPRAYMTLALADTAEALEVAVSAGLVPPASLTGAAYRAGLCRAAATYCHDQGDRAFHGLAAANSWPVLRKMLSEELTVTEDEVTQRALQTMDVPQWERLIADGVGIDRETGGIGHTAQRAAMWTSFAELVRERLGAPAA